MFLGFQIPTGYSCGLYGLLKQSMWKQIFLGGPPSWNRKSETAEEAIRKCVKLLNLALKTISWTKSGIKLL